MGLVSRCLTNHSSNDTGNTTDTVVASVHTCIKSCTKALTINCLFCRQIPTFQGRLWCLPSWTPACPSLPGGLMLRCFYGPLVACWSPACWVAAPSSRIAHCLSFLHRHWVYQASCTQVPNFVFASLALSQSAEHMPSYQQCNTNCSTARMCATPYCSSIVSAALLSAVGDAKAIQFCMSNTTSGLCHVPLLRYDTCMIQHVDALLVFFLVNKPAQQSCKPPHPAHLPPSYSRLVAVHSTLGCWRADALSAFYTVCNACILSAWHR